MSSFWSAWIIVITLGTLIALMLLLRWNMTNYTGVEEGEPMGHEFDGISELNNPLPKWWTILFWLCFAWGFVYLALYPGLGNFKGLLGWTSSNQGVLSLEESRQAVELAREQGLNVQYDRERMHAEEKYGPIFQQYASLSIEEIAAEPEAVQIGQRLFLQNCAQCHGSDARGSQGFPNLTDGVFNWGGKPQDIYTTIMKGRNANMASWVDALGEQGVVEVATYVLSLNGRSVDRDVARAGEAIFKGQGTCFVCHGSEGQGNPMLGAPNLTNNIWLYGGSQKAVEETIRHGRNGVMPSWENILGEDKVKILAGYVLSLNAE
ncbi:cytochrome-c oxidase, cbb3-type subunit III [Aliidiomarina taiwanensis]|uniref:Cbb3-type cytochrome c oxidase subunit n=1 Tax=Aliidiomarina taiwanensis TaxID=946228 RepID=A0A432XA16_9GAMM|nr:cytochrome-c oxidase, cbb3-type subunit III [Aliidiomarina taiwanensis]RUO44164.1 cytochrome-c oxidase, cbb3-type subunit III [Aliidiomarina taiwanensis]